MALKLSDYVPLDQAFARYVARRASPYEAASDLYPDLVTGELPSARRVLLRDGTVTPLEPLEPAYWKDLDLAPRITDSGLSRDRVRVAGFVKGLKGGAVYYVRRSKLDELTSPATQGTLSATEAPDTASLAALAVTSGELSATEASDTASFTASAVPSDEEVAKEVIREVMRAVFQPLDDRGEQWPSWKKQWPLCKDKINSDPRLRARGIRVPRDERPNYVISFDKVADEPYFKAKRQPKGKRRS